MSWDDHRTVGALGTVARKRAHSDDAKQRSDDSSNLRPRAKWVVPAVVAGVVILLIGGTAVAMTTRGHDAGGSGDPSTASGENGDAKEGGTANAGTDDATTSTRVEGTIGKSPLSFDLACAGATCTVTNTDPPMNDAYDEVVERTFRGGNGTYRSSQPPMKTCADMKQDEGSIGFTKITLTVSGEIVTLSGSQPEFTSPDRRCYSTGTDFTFKGHKVEK